jgi:OTU domain-containing protein 6
MEEDPADLEARHEREKADLEQEIQTQLSTAKSKNDRKRINQNAEKLRRELFARQEAEFNGPPDVTPPPLPPVPEVRPPPDTKKEQNRQKRMKKLQQKQHEDAELAQVARNAKTAGQIEIESLDAQLATINLKMRPVIGDGHCLYRAVAFCLSQRGYEQYSDPQALWTVRQRVAKEMRENPDQYRSFTMSETDEMFLEYCNRVETSSEWGDEVEVLAAANAFQMGFVVHRLGAPPSQRGEFSVSAQLAFLAHFTPSGGHYNPIIPV